MSKPWPPGARIADYRLLKLLGQGSQSQVFLAERQASRQLVALKLSPRPHGEDAPAAVRAFLVAARRLQTLPPHAHVVTVLDAGVADLAQWLAMEAVPGHTLARYTHAARLLPEPLVLLLAQRVAQALAHAHAHGLVHRDLKPANVLVHLPSHTVKLGDFGLARSQDAEASATGLMLGTPAYMAPEQLAGTSPTPQSDLYALGVLLFELLTARRPHEGASMGELLRQLSQQPATDLAVLRPTLPAGLRALVNQLLQRDPGQRGASADDVAQTLLRLSAELSPGPVPSLSRP